MAEKNQDFVDRRKISCNSSEDCRFADAVEKLEKREIERDVEMWAAVNKRVPYQYFYIIIVIAMSVIGGIGYMAKDSASKTDILNLQKDLAIQIDKIDTRLYNQQQQMITYYQDRRDDDNARGRR